MKIHTAQTLQEQLRLHAQQQSEALFLIAPENDRRLSYGELAQQTGRFARWAAGAGLKPGDRIAMLLPNGMQAGLIFLAAMATGHVIVPLNLLATPAQLLHCLRHSKARKVITCEDLVDSVQSVLPQLPEAQAIPEIIQVDPDAAQFEFDGPSLEHAPAPGPDDIALLMYTSGTTGVPKGVPLSHANLLHGARSVAQWHGLGPDDRVLSALPLYHINGQVIATLTPFISGGSIVAPRRFSASRWWEFVERYECTWLNMVPTIIAYLLNAEPAATDGSHTSVRFGRSASAPLPVEHHQAFEQRFGVPVIEAMGMTETSSVIFCNPQDPAGRRYGSPGLPCGVEARVAGKDGGNAADGEIGEVMLRGPNVMQGYLDNPEETAKAFDSDGWLRTGDLGYRDAEGYYRITGRIKELIIKGGENIAPREIDEALLGHAAVLEAAAVGLPDENYGQEIYAAVTLKPGALVDEAELLVHCRSALGSYKSPREIRIIDELPKGPSGKVQRLKLVDLWAETEVSPT
ncbi:AMP-binding protein [Pusillimonas sp. MFBS29]|uniref:AMP-binding protein n=1 Tax=Pusillimonas sp. MFBS29 TaxID=2886690 RepID=UPI001D1017E2|nr:AMP-binding protein [Pusillimonas sp. MFBS29]MCC2597233.1 AMP-binding protein [Pusillimonas sp. MFBS29]